MKNVLKRSISVVLALTLIFSSAYVGLNELDFGSLFAVKSEAASTSDLTFTLNSDGDSYSVTACNTSSSGSLVIPSTYNGKPVTSIGSSAFYNCTSLVSIEISDSVTSIGDYAFYNCTSLASIEIPDSVTSIGWYAFLDTGYSNDDNNWENKVLYIGNHLIQASTSLSGQYIIKEGTKTIAAPAFHSCAYLTSITIPDSVISIGEYAFYNCTRITSITIPYSITNIGDNVFDNTSIKDVYYRGTKADWENISIASNNDYLKHATIYYHDEHFYNSKWIIDVEATCTEDGSKSHRCIVCGKKGNITVIPSLGHDFEVVSTEEKHPHTISYKCSRCPYEKEEEVYFENCVDCNFTYEITGDSCSITGYIGKANTFVIPSSVNGKAVKTTKIGAFRANTTLTSVRIEAGVESIAGIAFNGCSSLSKVVIPESVTSIGIKAFYNCASDFTIYCYRDSYAMQYAIDNSLNYIVMDIGETENTRIDYANKIIFTSETFSSSIDDIVYTPSSSMAFAEASIINGSNEFLGTGSIVTVFDDDNLSEYTLIVEGDLNGDATCDVIDASVAYLYSVGLHEATENEILAANGCSSEEIDANSYQSVVNTCLAS